MPTRRPTARSRSCSSRCRPGRRWGGSAPSPTSAIWPTWPKTATAFAAARCTSAPATPRRAASNWPWRACARPALRPRPSRRRWPAAMWPRCSRPTRPRCSARAFSTPSATSPNCWPSATTSRRAPAANEALLRARVTQLWQTRLLRYSKLTVADEIENALSYYEATFLRQIPEIYAALENALGQHPVHSFLRMGQWIGGDRDGNPNATAQTLQYALGRQAEVALRHYLTEVHYLGGELSLSTRLVQVSAPMQALALRSPDRNEHRQDEPYRLALTGIYARLAATLKALTGGEAARHAVAPQNAYASAQEFLADLRVIEDSLTAHHGAALAAGRLRQLIRAV